MTIFCPGCHKETPDETKCGHCGRNTRLNGRWVLEQMVGHGASGYTWRARDAESGEVVAIKELSFRRLTDIKAIELFEREVRALESITHPGIPKFIDEFTVEEDRFVSAYLVQEFIDGSVINLNQRTTEAKVLEFLEEMASLLDVIHSMRPPVIHRDIKPANVMRRKDGRYVLIDFGAIRASTEKSMGGSTMAGTPGYMAPEQLLGKAEPASDFYGLGATAVAMLAGQDAHDLIDSHDPTKWRKKVQVSDAMGDLLEAMLQPKTSDRIRSSKALRSTIAKSKKPPKASPEVVKKLVLNAPRELPAAAFWGGLSLVIGIATYERFSTKSFSFVWEIIYGSAGGDLGDLYFFIVWVLFSSAFVLLVTWFVSTFWKDGKHEYLRPAIFSPMLGILLATYSFGPQRISDSDVLWIGERNGELRVSVIGRKSGVFQVSTFSVPDTDRMAVRALRGDCSGFSNGLSWCQGIQVTPNGSAWVRGQSKATLWDLWSGEKLFDVSERVDGPFIPKEVVGEKLLVDLPNQDARPFGPETVPEPTRWGTLQSSEFEVSSTFSVHKKLKRHRLFFKDSTCGYLVHHNTLKEGFGPGEQLLSGLDDESVKWTHPLRNIIGKDELLGAIGGTSKCFLVAKSRSKLKFYSWNPETGASEFFFSLKHGKPAELMGEVY